MGKNSERTLIGSIIMILFTAAVSGNEGSPLRPVSTYSIVARDPDTGQLGVAVQSH